MTVSVLIVDDSPIARKMLRRALPPDWDISIQEAADGAQAIDFYRQGGVELMFLDLTMPNIDGYGVLEVLQAEGLNCIVIVVSADVQPQARERVLSMGAIAFIPKPVNPEGLQDVLRQYGILV
jgi:two-component system, chemotaxis family, chemotaxis protein CheY